MLILENGMEESDHPQVTLKINASEEVALMDLLNFIYIDSLSGTTIQELMDVQMAAEKFEVTSCTRYCSQKLPVSLDDQDELHNHDLSSSPQSIKDAAKKYLVERHRDLTTHKCQEEAMALPLSALEVVLGSDGLHVNSEEDVINMILKWGSKHYQNLEICREILTKRLARFIHFPNICPLKLSHEVLHSPYFDPKETWRLAWNSFQFHAGDPYGHRILVDAESPTGGRLVKRVYRQRPVKVVYIPKPKFSCFVYFTLTKEECNEKLMEGRDSVYSQAFLLGRRRSFSLVAECKKDERTSVDHFALYLYKNKNRGDYKSCTIHFEFQVMKKCCEGSFERIYKACDYTFKAGIRYGKHDLFAVSWDDFMADHSPYFVDGLLHLRAHLVVMG